MENFCNVKNNDKYFLFCDHLNRNLYIVFMIAIRSGDNPYPLNFG